MAKGGGEKNYDFFILEIRYQNDDRLTCVLIFEKMDQGGRGGKFKGFF